MRRTDYLARITATEPCDTEGFRAAQRLLRELAASERARQLLDEGGGTDYMPPVPRFQGRKLGLSEAMKAAMGWDVSGFIYSCFP